MFDNSQNKNRKAKVMGKKCFRIRRNLKKKNVPFVLQQSIIRVIVHAFKWSNNIIHT